MEYQLGAIDLQTISLKRDLATIGQAVNIQLLGDWESMVRENLADLQVGLDSLNAAPQSDEERQEIFALKRQIVNTLVKRITIDRDRQLHVEISLDLLSLLEGNSETNLGEECSKRGQNWPGGTYSRTQSAPVHRRRYAFCA